MAEKVTVQTIDSLQNQTSAILKLNANFNALAEKIDDLVSRDGDSPNQMESAIDMNSYRITNLPEPINGTEPARKVDLDEAVLGAIPDLSIDTEKIVEYAVTSTKLAPGAAVGNIGFTPENSANKNQNNGYAGLDSTGKVPSALLPADGSYKGTWNANTNTPTITSGVGVNNDFYKVSVSGTTTIDGVSSWAVGDEIRFNGTSWQKIAAYNAVTSVNGNIGAVTITKTDLNLGNVDNTSDVNKPISIATQTALDLKLNATHAGTGGTAHSNATTGTAGFMSATDKTKLDGIASGATANATDAQLRDRSTHTGTQTIATISGLQTSLDLKLDATHAGTGGTAHAAATTSVAGFMSSADKSKLDGVQAGATANATDADLRDRSTHTGTQAHTTITGLGNSATRNVGTTAGTVAAGDDSRLSDQRTPTDLSVTTAKIVDLNVTDAKIAGMASTKLTGTIDDARFPTRLGDAALEAKYARPTVNNSWSASQTLTLDNGVWTADRATTGAFSGYSWNTAGVRRWLQYINGANGDLILSRYNLGSYVGDVFTADPTTGLVTIPSLAAPEYFKYSGVAFEGTLDGSNDRIPVWDASAGAYRLTSPSAIGATNTAGVGSFNGRSGTVSPASGDYNASQITNAPAGGISSTNVQAALAELDSEKGGLGLNNTWTGTNTFNALVDLNDKLNQEITSGLSGGTYSPFINTNVQESYTAGSNRFIANAFVTEKLAGGTGHRNAIYATVGSVVDDSGKFIDAITGISTARSGASGSYFGINGYATSLSGALTTTEVIGGEMNTSVRNTSVARKCGMHIADVDGSTGAGTVYDAALNILKSTDSVGYLNGILFSDNGTAGNLGVKTTGTFMKADGGTVVGGIDFSAVTFTDHAFKSNAFRVKPDGKIEALGFHTKQGTAGSIQGNVFNIYWNGTEAELYIDTTRLGKINVTP